MEKQWLLLFFLGISQLIIGQSLQTGIQLFEAEKYNEAQKVFLQVLEETPENVTALEYMGDVLFKQEKWGAAAAYFKQLVKKEKSNATYHYKYAGAIGIQAKHNKLKALFLIDDIKYHFKKAASLNLNYVDARVALVQLYTQLPKALGGNLQTAKKYAEEVKPLDPKIYHELMDYLTNL